MPKRRKVDNLVALAVLATLSERPMHPYEIASTLHEQGKDHSFPIKWGSLYTVVANLDKHGFIEAAGSTRQGRRPERTVYRITDAGREELEDWLRELVSVPRHEPVPFEAALSVLVVLPPGEAVRLLEQRLRMLELERTAEQAALDKLSHELPRLLLIEAEYVQALRRAEADWVRSLCAELKAGTLPGVREWRAGHETGQDFEELFRAWKEGTEADQT